MLRLTDALNAPLQADDSSADKSGPQRPPSLSRKEFRARLAQIEGKYEDAVRNYTVVQIARGMFPPNFPKEHPAFRYKQLHDRAAEDATFFIGLCKLEQ